MSVNSPQISATYVRANIVIMWNTVEGMTRRFVLKVSKPSPFSVSVRYWVGVVSGIWNMRPMIYSGHRS